MNVTEAWLAAEAERLRDQFEADRLADDLGCEVTLNPHFAGVFDVRKPVPGVWLLIGTPDEIRAEWRAARSELRAAGQAVLETVPLADVAPGELLPAVGVISWGRR